MKLSDDASAVVSKRSSMTLFSDSTNHYSHRVRIVLAEKGVTVDLIESDSGIAPAELADVNPYNTMPTLVDRDLVLYESKVMMEYLDERFPHPPLLPVYPVARAESRLLMYRIERDWCSLVDAIQNSRSDNVVTKSAKELRDGLMAIAPIFAEKPYFMSEEFTLVDCCIAPILWRLPSLGVDIRPGKQSKPLLAYMDSLFRRESFQESLTVHEREMRL
ncbi:glutathione S-transferase N-terminal domain-containing protein [Luminiphilus sp. nBUS_16]|jgi:RNA polymerase-associated protein|uniref:glutathione S-transferase N-terminal domain-containing protein n=1 Tax=unclassified Luminiphilus TaxID=2633198 RepID=UPI000126B775|nr:glutathione S-transferase N-terminal domain-containing protein [Luminiphilus sp.]MDB4581775.1 glutathione S-transferase N-terminal domain-containing protein [Draconibacterium sp.]MDA7840172.1 glutathione S-transferase N-terminal domain-containing protein [Luminiphilus sp.]MDA8659838.1 glutathione S-transferase N-terminal domain-containing protein [Luminiphilus sp.]MDA8772963.1 glutathione S-transferase N-terminal domain-containing protein [Luminiphilus sp.]